MIYEDHRFIQKSIPALIWPFGKQHLLSGLGSSSHHHNHHQWSSSQSLRPSFSFANLSHQFIISNVLSSYSTISLDSATLDELALSFPGIAAMVRCCSHVFFQTPLAEWTLLARGTLFVVNFPPFFGIYLHIFFTDTWCFNLHHVNNGCLRQVFWSCVSDREIVCLYVTERSHNSMRRGGWPIACLSGMCLRIWQRCILMSAVHHATHCSVHHSLLYI